MAKNLDPDQAERIFQTLDSVREAVNKKTRKVEILLFYFNEIFPELLIITIHTVDTAQYWELSKVTGQAWLFILYCYLITERGQKN